MTLLIPQHVVDYTRLYSKQSFYLTIVGLHKEGWSLQEIADSYSVSKSAAAAWERKGLKICKENNIEAPLAPADALKPKIEKKPSKAPKKEVADFPIEEQQKIAQLAPMASRVSKNTPANSPSRKAANELVALLDYHSQRGVSLSRLANAAGVTRRAIAQRLEKKKKVTV